VAFAPDGSPVELYASLPERGEGDLVALVVPAGGSILELGCGAGRITRQLVARGFNVVAVDESAEMLAHVRNAEIVCESIEGLDAGRRFDAVLLASNLLAVEDETQRRAFLTTCRDHSDVTIVETLPLGWEPVDGRETQLGDVTARLHVERFRKGVVRGRMDYENAQGSWSHAFSMRVFADEAELERVLGEAGMQVDWWLDRERGWFVASVAK
jgi:SAM-dependent methyltransferase